MKQPPSEATIIKQALDAHAELNLAGIPQRADDGRRLELIERIRLIPGVSMVDGSHPAFSDLPAHWSLGRKCSFRRQELTRPAWTPYNHAVENQLPKNEIDRLYAEAIRLDNIPDHVIIEAEAAK